MLCGVDLGGTKLAVILMDDGGVIRDESVVYDHKNLPDQTLVMYMCELVQNLLAQNHLHETDLAGIGVGFPGHLRFSTGTTITTSNLPGLKNFPLKQTMQAHFQIPVVVDNDANAQTYAEFRYGAGRGYDSMIFLTVSTGVGGGIIINRKLYRGLTGTAGEFGHMIVDPQSPIRCGCGNYGCLMGCASGLTMLQIVQRFLDQGVTTSLLPEQLALFDGKMLKEGFIQHDPLCERVLAEYGRYLGIGINNIFQIFNPPVIVLGGGLINLGQPLLQAIENTFHSLAQSMLYDPLPLRVSELGDRAGVIGAAALVLEQQA
jgi:glucokinase